jgi:hypothetical protein
MALSKEEVAQIARCKARCLMAGMTYADQIYAIRDEKYPASLFPINVAGLVPASDLIVPHSELAMHVGAAGKQLMAWAIREDGRYAHVVFEDGDGCCAHTHGLPHELMTPGLVRKTAELLHIKEV